MSGRILPLYGEEQRPASEWEQKLFAAETIEEVNAVAGQPFEKHYGPGPHAGTGSPQSVHGGEEGKLFVGALRADSEMDGYTNHLFIGGEHSGVHAKGIVEWRDLPPLLFHVTTRGHLVDEDGVLRANRKGGLGGQSGDKLSVSLTTSPEIVYALNRDIKMMTRLYDEHWDSKPDDYRTPEWKEWSAGIYRSLKVEAKEQGWEFGFMKSEVATMSGYGISDWSNQFFHMRTTQHPDNRGKKWNEGSPLWRNPLFFGMDKWGPKLSVDNIKTYSIPKWTLNPEVLVSDFDLDRPIGLEEVRYWGDIQLPGDGSAVEKRIRNEIEKRIEAIRYRRSHDDDANDQ